MTIFVNNVSLDNLLEPRISGDPPPMDLPFGDNPSSIYYNNQDLSDRYAPAEIGSKIIGTSGIHAYLLVPVGGDLQYQSKDIYDIFAKKGTRVTSFSISGPSTVSQSTYAGSPSGTVSASATVTASGGNGSYSYSWSKESGGGSGSNTNTSTITVTDNVAASTTSISTWRCTVTSGGLVRSMLIDFYLENLSSGGIIQ